MSNPKLAIVILNWNGLTDTLECLKTVTDSDNKTVIVSPYVVDNASTDQSSQTIPKKYPNITYIQNSKNLGYAGGNNLGIKQALKDGVDYIVLLNNDTTVNSTTFNHLYQGALQHHFHIASPKIYFYPGREYHHDHYTSSERGKVIWYAGGRIDWQNVIPSHIGVDEVDHDQWNQTSPTDFATGCCMLIDPKVFARIGFLDASYTAYFEDTDFCQRARKAGFAIGYVPGSTMWHKNAGSTGGSGSSTQVSLVDSSRFKFGLRHAPTRAKLALIKHRFFR